VPDENWSATMLHTITYNSFSGYQESFCERAQADGKDATGKHERYL
jgi:hypothetical protein